MEIFGIEMETKKAVLWVAIGLLALAVAYVTFFKDTASAVRLGANAGEAASRYSGMVGGC